MSVWAPGMGWFDGWNVDPSTGERLGFNPRTSEFPGYVPISGTPDEYRAIPAYARVLRDGDFVQKDGQWYMSTDAQGRTSAVMERTGGLGKMLNNGAGFWTLAGLGMGGALGGAFPGIDAAGMSIPAGQSGILSQLGLSNPLSNIPQSIKNLFSATPISGGGGAESLIGGAAADTLGGAAGEFGLAPAGSGIGGVGAGGTGFGTGGLGLSAAGLGGATMGLGGYGLVPATAAGAGAAVATAGSIWGPIATIGSSIIGGLLQNNAVTNAANQAAGAQTAASSAGQAELRRQFDAVQALLKPYVDAGTGSLVGQLDLLGLRGPQAQQTAIQGLENSPAFTSLTQQGENAMLQNASATGGLRGGNLQGALAKFRPELLAKLIDRQYSNLGGITSMGANAAAGVGNAGMTTGVDIARLLQQQGSSQAGLALARGGADARMYADIAGGIGQFAGMGGFEKLPNLNLF